MSIGKIKKISSPKGRKQTDKSLKAERAKTDASLLKERKQTELQADEAVSTNRADADETRSQARLASDASGESDRAVPGGSRLGDRLDSDERLRRERRLADHALEEERRHVDSVLDGERKQKGNDEHGFFAEERSKTDRDLTDERNQNDAEAERAAVALTTRDEFLAIVSHDLRSPLGSISMAAQMLRISPLYAAADSGAREYLDIIERNVGEALRLIADLMDIECIAAGKLGLQMRPHDVGEMIQDAVKSFQPMASDKKISIQVSFEDHGVTAMCDRDRIAQVLSNLIANAIKFTSAHGLITLAVAPGPGEGMVQISVRDTGPGISEDMHKKIFERFWQIGKQDRRGLGLGLYISRVIVESHRGRLWVESQIGVGSKFCFTLPSGPSPLG